jgi:hypothetical protein
MSTLLVVSALPSQAQTDIFHARSQSEFTSTSNAFSAFDNSDFLALGATGGSSTRGIAPSVSEPALRPFSRIAFFGGFSPLGIGFQTATNLNRHFNLRANGNYFNYTASNISTEGFDVTAKLKMSSAGASLDYYPFHAGFRVSPGVLFYNQNHADATFVAASGTSFTLDNNTYYSASGANAVVGQGAFGLGNGSPAFTATTGWGNVIPASGRHLSFPFEIGAAFIKSPTVALNLSGFVCNAQGQNCVNVATDATAQSDLAAQVKKYQNDVNLLKTYPIVSFGVAYNFRLVRYRSTY